MSKNILICLAFIIFIGVIAYVLFTNGFKNLQNQSKEYTLSPQTANAVNTTASSLDALANTANAKVQSSVINIDTKKIDADTQENLARQKKASTLGKQVVIPEKTNRFNP
ncbi:MAG: hypothetical protein EXS50_02740 [Candidatus Taylorbacteria bacterium]|nr:hypothetical protein [Candidatus Taylorbacteria bacterium]